MHKPFIARGCHPPRRCSHTQKAKLVFEKMQKNKRTALSDTQKSTELRVFFFFKIFSIFFVFVVKKGREKNQSMV